MNREKKDQLPAMQVSFIDSICLPVYEVRLLHQFTRSVKLKCFLLPEGFYVVNGEINTFTRRCQR
jgi:hypothetical protein